VLLALAMLIALIGIANTLALSIRERTRELGLLRAVGATRRRLRAMVRAEAVVISVFGAVEGLVLGTLFGLAVVTAMRSAGVSRLSVPVLQLILLTALASLAGLVAAILPGRRAARLNILKRGHHRLTCSPRTGPGLRARRAGHPSAPSAPGTPPA
jgi:putative ABC transport system permease protein